MRLERQVWDKLWKFLHAKKCEVSNIVSEIFLKYFEVVGGDGGKDRGGKETGVEHEKKWNKRTLSGCPEE